jgi:3D (Asp-Asp-Asp) domain-containing protein
LDLTQNPPCQSATSENTFGETCQVFTGQYTNNDGGSGIWTCNRLSTKQAKFTSSDPIIPKDIPLQNKKALTKAESVTVTLTDDGRPLSGVVVAFQSDRPAVDSITNPSTPTNAAGSSTGQVETRDQTANSNITLASAEIPTVRAARIKWLPAKYQNTFLVTCYAVTNEDRYANTPLVGPVKGLPADKKYREGFISDVRFQGSGIASDGTTIHWEGNGRYAIRNCPLTASGACAVDGTTVAIDPKIIPLRSKINVDGLGSRQAQDTGGRINNYHIDEYFGSRYDQCLKTGVRNLGIALSSY